MWVEGGDIHDELLDQLGGVLAPPEDFALFPSAAELDALAAMVAARWPEGAVPAPAPATTKPPAEAVDASRADSDAVVHRLRWAGPRARRLGSSAWRAGSVAAGLVLFSASAAAAANGGVPLPRPVRVVAYSVGLPVDSPALDDTHQHIEELKDAVEANDKPKAEATVRRLQTDLTKVPADEVKKAEPKVEKAIEEAVNKGVVTSPVPTTTTTTAPPLPSTTATLAPPPSSTTVTTAEEKSNEREKGTERPTVTPTTAPPTTTTTAPEPTTTTTAPETDDTAPDGETGDPGAGDGHSGAGDGGDPGTTPTTVPETTTTTSPPPDETTTTTTTTVPESTTTTTTAPTGP